MIIRIIQYFILSLLVQSCAIWPYKSDFDCEMPAGEYCKSLYQINKKADNGDYEPRDEDENEYLQVKANKPKCCKGKR
jgi:hypothetical protein